MKVLVTVADEKIKDYVNKKEEAEVKKSKTRALDDPFVRTLLFSLVSLSRSDAVCLEDQPELLEAIANLAVATDMDIKVVNSMISKMFTIWNFIDTEKRDELLDLHRANFPGYGQKRLG